MMRVSHSSHHAYVFTIPDKSERRGAQQVLDSDGYIYSRKKDRNVRVLAFATSRNLATLAQYNDWIADGTYYIAPKIFA